MFWSHLAGGVVGVLGQFGVHAVQTDRVSDFANREASFVQNGDDAFVWLLHEVHNDLVVEVINLCINSMIVKQEGNVVMIMNHVTARNFWFL